MSSGHSGRDYARDQIVKRELIPSTAFNRLVKRLTKRQPGVAASIHATLQLAADAFHAQLKTHKLAGKWVGSWSCSAGYDLRIVFEFVQFEDAEAILLQSIGTHDEVY
jgi:mRNA-degrading endonuclease YafQ of YafQ-DinJ toxin-antitoxin module